MFMHLFRTLIRHPQVRGHLRQSIGDLLSRSDDHLLQDIGLTRHQAERLVADARLDTAPIDGPLRIRAVKGMARDAC